MFTAPKASTTARGYGPEHRKTRARLLPTAYGKPCSRCGRPMLEGQRLHLDHNDTRTGYLGFSHAACNLKAAARKGQRLAHAKAKAKAKAKRMVVSTRPSTASRW